MRNKVTPQEVLDTYMRLNSQRLTAEALGVSHWFVRKSLSAYSRGKTGKPDLDNSLQLSDVIKDETNGSCRIISSTGIETEEELLKKAGVNLDEWIVDKKMVNCWDAMSKDGPVKMYQIKVWLTRKPSFYITAVQPISPTPRKRLRSTRPVRTAVIIPDSQHGFRSRQVLNKETGIYEQKLIPMHDRKACDAALIVCEQRQPDEIILMGDMVDFADFSKYSLENDAKFLVQPMLMELFWWLQSIRRSCPRSKIRWLAGNHELRLQKALQDKLPQAADLRPVTDIDGPPSLSIERLMSLDQIDVDYIPEYGKPYWLFDKIKCHHGYVVRPKGGQTVSSILSGESSYSHIVGHIHRREIASRTTSIPVKSDNGETISAPQTIYAMSPGCLCSLDNGIVPSYKGKPELDWQQGVGIVEMFADQVFMNIVPIEKGRFILDGIVYEGQDRIEDIRKATGLNV